MMAHDNFGQVEGLDMAKSAKKPQEIVTLKVTLRGTRPPIWRRVEVTGSTTLGELHFVIMAAMGWTGGHLHLFEVAGRQYGDPSWMEDVANEKRLTVGGVLKSGLLRFSHTYDLGNSWEHNILIEKKAPAVEGRQYPVCTDGKRNCPPEDCGGVDAYKDMLDALKDHSRVGDEQWADFIEEGFDPEEFSVEVVNDRMNGR